MPEYEGVLEVPYADWTLGERGTRWPLNRHTIAYANALVVKSGPGKLYGFTVYNSAGGTQFIQVHDAAAVPASGAVPALFFPVATVSTVFAGWGDVGRAFDVGCVLTNSSTGPTYTAGSTDTWFDAQYV